MSKTVILLLCIVAAAVLVYALFLLWRTLGRAKQDAVVGTVAPPFFYAPFTDSGAHTPARTVFSPTHHREVTLFVFEVGCVHCFETMPYWNHIAAAVERGQVYGVSMSPRGATAQFIRDTEARFPVLLAGPSMLGVYGITGTPATITIVDGIVKQLTLGKPDDEAVLRTINYHAR